MTMKMLRTSLGVALLVVCPGTPRAQVFETYDFITLAVSARLPIPDGDAAGVSDVRTITSVITQISSITVSLDISGEFNGDLYASLRHDSGFSVLLNRPGRTSLSPAGYGDSGLNVTLSDGAANGDIHLYRTVLAPEAGSPLTGEWQSDGRNVDPGLVLDTSPRTAGLDVFNGLNANGEWMLFVADLQSCGANTLQSL